jgi:hypothetical protein
VLKSGGKLDQPGLSNRFGETRRRGTKQNGERRTVSSAARRMQPQVRGAQVSCELLTQCFFGVVADAGVTRMGGAPVGEVAGVDFFACFGFLTSRLLRI